MLLVGQCYFVRKLFSQFGSFELEDYSVMFFYVSEGTLCWTTECFASAVPSFICHFPFSSEFSNRICRCACFAQKYTSINGVGLSSGSISMLSDI